MKSTSRFASFGLLAIALAATPAFAASSSGRAGTGNFYLFAGDWGADQVVIPDVTLPVFDPNPPTPTPPIQATSDLKFDWGNTFLFGFGGAYYFTDLFAVRGELSFGSPSYDMTWNDGHITGESWIHNGKLNIDMDLLKGRKFTPYISAGIGYMYMDTGIPDGPPEFSYWWDYYWGPVLVGYQPTHQETFFTYNAAIGLKWNMTDAYGMGVSWTTNWVDAERGTVRTGEASLSFTFNY